VLACGSEIGEDKNDNGSIVRKYDIYNGKGEKLVLASLSDLYLELEVISVDIIGLSSCSTLHCLLATYTTNYCSKENIHNFGLRRLFYSKQDLINTCYPLG